MDATQPYVGRQSVLHTHMFAYHFNYTTIYIVGLRLCDALSTQPINYATRQSHVPMYDVLPTLGCINMHNNNILPNCNTHHNNKQ